MATRNLTEPFVLMRNNALQSKRIYAEQVRGHNLFLLIRDNAVAYLVYDFSYEKSDLCF